MIRFRFYLHFLIIITPLYCYSQFNWNWNVISNNLSISNNQNLTGRATTTDPLGNSITTGYYGDSVQIGSLAISSGIISSSQQSFFLSKHDQNGNIVWLNGFRHVNSQSLSVGTSIMTDRVGNIYVTGYYRDSVLIDNSILLSSPTGVFNTFISKYSPGGIHLWSISTNYIQAPGVMSQSLAIDSLANIFVQGSMTTQSTIYNTILSLGAHTLSNNIGANFFIAKLDSSGNVLWLRGSDNNCTSPNIGVDIFGIDVSKSGTSYLLGKIRNSSSSVCSAFVSTNQFIPFPTNNTDIVLLKYDLNGNVQWTRTFGGTGNRIDCGIDLQLDDSENLYSTGYSYSSSLSFGSHIITNSNTFNPSGYLAKFDSSGTPLWANSLLGRNIRYINSISRRDSNSFFVSGIFYNDTVFYQNNIFLPIRNDWSTLIFRVDSSGNLLCKGVVDSVQLVLAENSSNLSVVANSLDTSAFFTAAKNNNIFIGKCSCPDLPLAATLSGTQTICSGYPGQALMQFSGAGPYNITYTDGTTNTTVTGITNRYYFINATPSASVSYTLTAFSGASGPGPYSGMASIQVVQPPAAVLSSAQTICQGDSVHLSVQLSGTGPWRFTYASGIGNLAVTALSSPWTRSLLPNASFTWTLNNLNNFVCPGVSPPASAVTVGTRPGLSLSGGNIVCTGDSLTFSALMSGPLPWNLSYTDGSNPVSFTGLTASPFVFTTPPFANATFTLTGAAGCGRDTVISRTYPPPLQLSHTATPVSCFGSSDGTAQGNASGGTGGYSYVWNTLPAQSTASATGLSAGSWILSVTDAAGCQRRDTALILQPPLLSVSITATPVNCFGQSQATATALASGGTGSYSYVWNTTPAQSSMTASGLSAGTWFVEVRDAALCIARDTVLITEPTALQISLSAQAEVCPGDANGSATVAASGGTAPYGYQWQTLPVQQSITATGLSLGMVSVLVSDLQGCTLRDSILIPRLSSPMQWNAVIQPVSCHGGSNGSISLQVQNGIAPYSYSWSTLPVQTGATAQLLSAGQWHVLVSDSAGCVIRDTFTVTEPTALQATGIVTPVSCPGRQDGGILVQASGGTGPYTVVWNTSPAQTTTYLSGVDSGWYDAEIRDAAGCILLDRYYVGLSTRMQLQINTFPGVCNQPGTGTANVQVSGGTPGYSFAWNTLPLQNTPTATGLSAGTYEVLVIDSRGCRDSLSAQLVVPAPLTVNATATDVRCFGGSDGMAYAEASGGATPYQYSWNSNPINTTQTLTGQLSGQYTVTVTDTSGCIATTQVMIRQPQQLQSSISYSSPSCHGMADGSLGVNVSGGTGPYQYQWSHGPTTAFLQQQNAGTYLVLITDGNACTLMDSVFMPSPAPIVLQVSGNSPGCLSPGSGSAWAQVNGGTAPYTYLWTGGTNPTASQTSGLSAGTWSVQVFDARLCMAQADIVLQAPQYPQVLAGPDTFFCAGSGGVGINSLGSGGIAAYTYEWQPNNGSLSNAFISNPHANPDSTTVYQVWVTDAGGCRSPQPGRVTVQLIALPSVDVGADMEFCADAPGVFLSGQVLNPQSGGYRWRWIPATGLFCDTCATTYANPTVSTLYTLYAAHIPSGCSSDSTTLNSLSTVAVTVKPRPIVYGGPDTTLCPADSAILCATATGAGPLYSYEWSPTLGMNDSVLQCPSVSPPHAIDYFVVATSNGCESVADTVRVTIVPVPIVDAGTTGNICAGDSLRLQGQVQQGLNVQVRWRPTLGLSDSTILQPQASPTATGWYYLRSFHAGCGGIEDSVLIIVHPIPLVDAGADTLLCGDSTLIQLQGTYSGVPAPVQISWHPNGAQSLMPWVRPAQTTLYTLSVSSGTGITQCVAEDSVLITVLPIPEFTLYADTTTVCSGDSVQVQAVSVLSSGLAWNWSPVSGVSGTPGNWHIMPAQSGTYVLTSTAGQCSYADSLQLVVHPAVQAAFTMSQPDFCGRGAVQFQNLSQNGLHYLWHFGDSSNVDHAFNPRHEYALPGTYSILLYAYGMGGCHDSVLGSLPVQIHPEYTPEVITQPLTPLELFLPAGTISVSEQSKASVRWHWDFGDGSYHQELSQASHRYTRPGTYTVKLRAEDANGCTGHWLSGPITIREPSIFIPNVFSPNADGVGDVFRIGYDGNESFHLEIYDRWGVKQFETRNPSQHWDGRNLQGTEVSPGVYFYVLQIGVQKWQGDVTVVR